MFPSFRLCDASKQVEYLREMKRPFLPILSIAPRPSITGTRRKKSVTEFNGKDIRKMNRVPAIFNGDGCSTTTLTESAHSLKIEKVN
jgi:hypothetical protein